MIRAIAIDDESPALQVLANFCSRTSMISLEKVFTDTAAAVKYLEQHTVDLLFLDIQLPAVSGIDFYNTLPVQPLVIFTTAFSEYAIDGFNAKAVDFLLKPIQYNRFQQAIQKVIQQLNLSKFNACRTGNTEK
jgi:two-component SAPR family response regulator